MSDIFTYFRVSLPFTSRDVSIAISNLLQTTTARWRHGGHSMQTSLWCVPPATIPFLDTLLVRKESGEVKLLILRKNIHTDQYLNFFSHHPLCQKIGVIRTLLDRCETLVTEEEDKRKEREHIKEALTRCGYPQWTISTVQRKMKTKKEDNIRKKTVEKDNSKGMVVLPYVQGLSKTTSQIMKIYNVNTATPSTGHQ